MKKIVLIAGLAATLVLSMGAEGGCEGQGSGNGVGSGYQPKHQAPDPVQPDPVPTRRENDGTNVTITLSWTGTQLRSHGVNYVYNIGHGPVQKFTKDRVATKSFGFVLPRGQALSVYAFSGDSVAGYLSCRITADGHGQLAFDENGDRKNSPDTSRGAVTCNAVTP